VALPADKSSEAPNSALLTGTRWLAALAWALADVIYFSRTDNWRFMLRDAVWDWPETRDVTLAMRAVQF